MLYHVLVLPFYGCVIILHQTLNILLLYSSAYGHLCFHVLVIINNATLNIGVHIFLWTCGFSWVYI